VACFEKGSHVLLLLLSYFVSWSKTRVLLIFCRVRGKKGWQKSEVGSWRRKEGPEVSGLKDKDLKEALWPQACLELHLLQPVRVSSSFNLLWNSSMEMCLPA
jgi:hypothetical protein